MLALQRKDNRIESAEAIAARQFGIPEKTYREIAQTIEDELVSSASRLGENLNWARLENFVEKSGELWIHRYDLLAVEFATALRPMFATAAIEYVRLLTETITRHHRNKQPIPWQSISSRAIEFCDQFARWERSGEWLVNAFKNAGASSRIGPQERTAFLEALSIWAAPVEEEARRIIRRVALPVPEISSHSHSTPQNLTTAIIARIKRDNPHFGTERICIALDKRSIEVLPNWKAHEFHKWQAAWADPKFRNRVKKFISRVKPERPPTN